MKQRPLLAAIALAPVVMTGAGCVTDTTTTGVTPITGIVVRSDSVINGHGCGTAPGQVYKYVAAVYAPDADGGAAPLEASVYDCFSDATFLNVPTSGTSGSSFQVDVYAFEADAWSAAIARCPGVATGSIDAKRSCEVAEPDGGAPTPYAYADLATWQSTCSATQQAGVQVLAVCGS